MDGARHSHMSEISQMEKDKCDITYMWYLKKGYKWTYLQNRNRVTNVINKLMVTRGEGGKDKLGGQDWHIYTTIYKIDD